jgi:hypothetical protein
MVLGADPDLAQLRADRARNIAETARILARYADWLDRTTRPTRARICAHVGIAVATFKRARRWLQDHAYLGVVREGRTAEFRSGVLVDADAPNEAAVYVLCVPRRKPRQPPATVRQAVTEPLPVSRRDQVPPAREATRPGPLADDGSPAFIVAFLRRQVTQLRTGPGQSLSERSVLAIARPFLAARWSPADLAHAINHDPQAGAHRSVIAGVRSAAHWLAWRLAAWTEDPQDAWARYARLGRWDHMLWPVPAPSPSARVTAAAAAASRQRAEVLAPPAEPIADARAHADAIRAQLGWARTPEGPPPVRWIHYPDHAHHVARTGGRQRGGKTFQQAGQGLVLAIPQDVPQRTHVLVHYFPDAPEENYALDTEQNGGGE